MYPPKAEYPPQSNTYIPRATFESVEGHDVGSVRATSALCVYMHKSPLDYGLNRGTIGPLTACGY